MKVLLGFMIAVVIAGCGKSDATLEEEANQFRLRRQKLMYDAGQTFVDKSTLEQHRKDWAQYEKERAAWYEANKEQLAKMRR